MSLIPGIAPIAPLTPLKLTSQVDSVLNDSKLNSTNGAQKAGTDFTSFLNDALQQVDALQKNADTASINLATGQTQDMSTAMIALEKANLSLSLTVEVRNKALDAYNEIMRMQM